MAKKKDSDKATEKDQKDEKNDVSDDQEPNFSDPEGYADSISDEELLGDLLAEQPTEIDGEESIIVVDGVPQVEPERKEKLSSVITKIFSKFGTIVNEFYPKTETGHTKGYIFLEYSNPKHAAEAVKMANNTKLDKHHTFLVNLFTDFKKYQDIPDEWDPPEAQPYADQGNLHYYMLDQDANDQYLLIVGGGCNIQVWANSSPEPTLIEDRARWTETFIKWSPLGTYLATFHRKGVAIWGGPKFEQLCRFAHSGVQYIDFSPCEKYVVTFSPMGDDVHNHGQSHGPNDNKRLIIWDLRTGQEKRSFTPDNLSNWPVFRWSHDDKYFARIGNDVLSVYETPSFGLLEKKSLKIPGIRDFSWSPTDNILAYWVAEDKNVPARVTLQEIPSRIEIRAKNLFNVADCKMHWQKSGDYLCVNVNRYSKIIRKEKNEIKYNGMYYNFEIFHMREKQIPVDSVEIKEVIHAFAWEPIGNKFAIIHGDGANINVSFYGVKSGQVPSLLKRFEKKMCNTLFWSPSGQFIVLAGLRNLGGTLEFVDTNDFTIMNSTEHYSCSEVEWDPTGRYVVTAVSFWKNKMDTGYWMWSFQGKILKRYNVEGFCNLMWRPRLASLLTSKQLTDIKKNLKKYSVQFESKDRLRMSKASKELVEKRSKLMKEFAEYRARRVAEWQAQKTNRLQMRENIDTDELGSDPTNVDEEIVEFFIKEEIICID